MAEPTSITPKKIYSQDNDTLYSLGNIDENPLEDFLLVTVDKKKKETTISFVMNHPIDSDRYDGKPMITLGNYVLKSVPECATRTTTMTATPTRAEISNPSYQPREVKGPETSCKINGKVKGDDVLVSGQVMVSGMPTAIVLSPDGAIGLVSSSSESTKKPGVAVPELGF